MSQKFRSLIVVLVALVVLGVFNAWIVQDERLSQEGTVMLVAAELSEPQSSPLGDYVGIEYQIPEPFIADSSLIDKGVFVVRVDENHVATINRRCSPDELLDAGEHLLSYRTRGWFTRVGSLQYLFQEGHAEYFEGAHYAVLRVDTSGKSLLIGLADENFKVLEAPIVLRR